ncbi:alpha/beta hydrolase [Kribbella sancticallisti]|uniref:Alpha/beta hydrolase n=1 Tax=Kribbella sancticallisti TaxID=460087 RepID=A0ABP4QIS1_9ACTN
MFKVSSADGTTIAYDRSGSGAAVILVGGALCDRASTAPLAQQLSKHFTVVSYDRRGRGDSADTSPYSVAREVEDLGALITALGGTAAVYGHSSAAALVVEAAAAGLPITKVVLHEPPYGPDDDASQRESDQAGAKVNSLLAQDRRTEAVQEFLTMAGMPPAAAADLAAQPGMAEVAPTLAYDFAVMDSAGPGGRIPFGLLAKVTQPALAVCGSASPPFMIDSARAVAKALPGGRLVELEGRHHVVPPEVLAPVLTEFFEA